MAYFPLNMYKNKLFLLFPELSDVIFCVWVQCDAEIRCSPHTHAEDCHRSFMQSGEGNKLDEANYGTECHSTCRTHTAQLCTQPGSRTDLAKIHTITPRHVQARTAETQKKTHTQTHTSIHRENSKMFALRGQEITCVCSRSETCNTWQFFSSAAWVSVCLHKRVRGCVS